MSPQERAPLLRVTFEAELIHIVGHQHFVRCAAVRIVAIAAAHFAFKYRHVRISTNFGFDILVALETDAFLVNRG